MFQFLRSKVGTYMSPTTATLTTVHERLSAARDELATAEQAYQQKAVEIVLSDDPAAGVELRAAIATAKERIALCELAVVQAEKQETERQVAANVKANQAKVRAFSQHGASLQRASKEYEAACALEERAWRKIIVASASCRSLL